MSAVLEFDPAALVDEFASKFRRLSRDDIEDAVQDAALEIVALAEREPLDRPASALVRQRARWRLLTRVEQLGREVSLDDGNDEPRCDLAVDHIDFDAHARLREAADNPVLRRLLAAGKIGEPQLRRRGTFAITQGSAYSDETVAEVRRLRERGLTYPEIVERTGLPRHRVEKWGRGDLRRGPSVPGWSREAIVTAIAAVAREDGRVPRSQALVNDPRLPCLSAFYRHFDSWPEAIELAGLEWEPPRRWTRESVFAKATALAAKLGRTPTHSEWKRAGLPGMATRERLFGTTSPAKILAEAGASL